MVLPQPGSPSIKILCPPAAPSTMASIRSSCPLTSEKSISLSKESPIRYISGALFPLSVPPAPLPTKPLGFSPSSSCPDKSSRPSRNLIVSGRDFTGHTLIPDTDEASCLFSNGTTTDFTPLLLASVTMDKIPLHGLILPSSASSPIKA